MAIPPDPGVHLEKPSIFFLGSQMATGGAQRLLLLKALWFHQQGYRVCTAFLYDREGLCQSWQSSYPFPLINLDGWRKESSPLNPVRLGMALFRLFRLLTRDSYDVVESFTHHANLLGMPIAWASGATVRVASHHGRVENLPEWLTIVHRNLVNSSAVSRLVAVSEGVRIQAMIEEGITADKITVIPNGVVELQEAEQKNPPREVVRSRLGIPGDAQLILNVGRLVNAKGQVYLLEALARVLADNHKVTLAIAGEGPLRKTLQAHARTLGIERQVHLLGNRTDIPELLQAADLFVLPSLSEGMPVALLEALAAGLPVIATRVGGVADLIKDNENGLLIEPAEVNALSQGIHRLLVEPGLRDRLANAGKAAVQGVYTLQGMCEQYEQLFNSLMGAPK